MDHSPCGIATLRHLMCILFLNIFFPGVNAQVAQQNFDKSQLLNRCPTTTNSDNLWWSSLRDGKGNDPCQAFQKLRGSKFTIDCCFSEQPGRNHSKRDHGDDNKSSGGGGGGDHSSCGPCTIGTYNLASACIACERFPNTTAPSNEDTKGSNFLSSHLWMANNELPTSFSSGHHRGGFPQWTDTNATNDQFDVVNVLKDAKEHPSSAGHYDMSIQHGATSPSASASPTGSAQQHKLSAGAIAGSVIGGLLLLALLTLALLLFLRKRRRQRSAPSSEFSAVSGPTTQDKDEKPQQFNAKSWRVPALQRWQGTSITGASQHGLMSNTAWNRDIEKEKY